MVKCWYVNYIIVISIINSLLMKIKEVRENLPKKTGTEKQGGIIISQNSSTQLLNSQMTFKYSWILMKILETINRSPKK